jgi:hypothetical protein
MNEYNTELQLFAKSVIKQAKTNLTQKKKNVSKRLYNSLDFEIKVDDEGNGKLVFLMEDYGFFQDLGVRGKDPSRIKNGRQKAPSSPYKFGTGSGKGSMKRGLDKWIVQKGIAPRDKQGRFVSRETLKFLIARSIYFQGIEPSYFFTKPYQNLLRKLPSDLAESYGQVTADKFLQEIKNIKNG